MEVKAHRPRHWGIEKQVSVGFIISLILQTIAAVWWTAKLESRVEIMESYVQQHQGDADKLIRIEERIQYLSERISDMIEKMPHRDR